jgi:Flp pilus assembly protein TadD
MGGSKISRGLLLECAFLIVLAAVTFFAYWQALRNPFVALDDGYYVTDNVRVQQGLTFENIKWAFTTNMASNWHPLTWISHMIDVDLFGMDPRGHHLTSLVLHAANSFLVFVFLRRATGMRLRSFVVAALFAVHPLHVESVAWVAERKDVLSGLFGLSALIAYTWHARGPSLPRYLLVALVLALGLMSKPMLVTLPCVMLLLDYWPLRRFGEQDWRGPVHAVWLFLEKVPLFLLAALSSVVTFVVQREGGAVYSLHGLPLYVRLENVPVAYVKYIAKTLCPVNLSAFYPLSLEGIPLTRVMAAAVCLVALTAGALWLGRRYPYCVTGWFWFMGMLTPVIGILQFGNQAMADRYMYLPIAGLFIVIVWGIPDVLSQWRHRAPVLATLAVSAVAACVPLTVNQISYWRDTMTLWERSAQITESNRLAHYNLGCGYLDLKDYGRAAEHFIAALRAAPNDVESMTNLGVALSAQGRYDEAIPIYHTALTIKPDHVNAQINLGVALMNKGEYEQAAMWLSDALHLDPNNPDIHFNLGLTRFKQERYQEAVTCYLAALRLKPDHIDAAYCLGLALMREGRASEAADVFSKVLALQPNHALARRQLESIRASQ